MDRTLVLVKPDGVKRGLVGEVITRFERLGFTLKAMRLMRIDEGLASRHYAEHIGKRFYADLVEYIGSGDVVAMVVEGDAAVEIVRKVMGVTNGREAAPGTIRGDYAVNINENIVHGSDSLESAAREVALFFPEL